EGDKMIDPTIAAAGAAAAAVFSTELLKSAGSAAGKAVADVAARVVDLVRRVASRDPETGAAATLVEAKPTDEVRVAQLGGMFAERASDDEGLRTELLALIAEAREAGALPEAGAHIRDVSGG